MKHQGTMRSLIVLFTAVLCANAMQDEQNNQPTNTTAVTKKIFTYAGSLLPPDWSLVSILNERVIIGFNNGSARNALLDELPSTDRALIQRIQNGTIYSSPLSSAKEKISQWSSTVTSTVTKFGKSFKDQLDSFINKNRNATTPITTNNGTTIIQ